MTTLADLTGALHEALHAHLRASDFDLESNEAAGSVEVTTDDWTLTFEGFPETPVAYISVDNEPDEPVEYERAVHDAIRPAEMRALQAANAASGGAIASALATSGDPFSEYLGGVVGAGG
ncbi:MAG: hypothetical protein M3Y37_04370 [Chloroflexota bacterium]|nr:hypothetical protein [Chloroflexota bacterium]